MEFKRWTLQMDSRAGPLRQTLEERLQRWTQETASRKWTQEMEFGRWTHLMGCGFSLSIAWRRGVKILQASANSSLLQHFTVHSNVRGSSLAYNWLDRLPDKMHLGADKDVKDETLIRFRKAGFPEWGSVRNKPPQKTEKLFKKHWKTGTCIWTCRSNPTLSPAGWMTSQGSWSSPRI